LRLNWLREGSFGRYAFYALGELILIIVGILAALWIDNARQQQREAELEQFYLRGLRNEFHASLVKLDTLIAVNRSTYDTAKTLLNRIPKSETREDEAALAPLLIEALSFEIAYNPNNSLLNEMISSGRLQSLSDSALRQHLTSWESFLESVDRQEISLRSSREGVMEVMLSSGGSMLSIMQDAGMDSDYITESRAGREHSNLPVLRSIEFENRILLFMVTAESTESQHYRPLREKILAILERIEEGLKE
jgi:hypothetical protein